MNIKIVKESLIKEGKKYSLGKGPIKTKMSKSNPSKLIYAVRYGTPEEVKDLLEIGANKFREDWNSLINYTLENNDIEKLKLLLDDGLDKFKSSKWKTKFKKPITNFNELIDYIKHIYTNSIRNSKRPEYYKNLYDKLDSFFKKNIDPINEVGEVMAPLDYKRVRDFTGDRARFEKAKEENEKIVLYEFSTINQEYESIFISYSNEIGTIWDYHFDVKGGLFTENSGVIINKGDLFKVMATNVAIIKDFIYKVRDPILISGKIENVGLENHPPKFINRIELYLKYIEKNKGNLKVNTHYNDDGSIRWITINV